MGPDTRCFLVPSGHVETLRKAICLNDRFSFTPVPTIFNVHRAGECSKFRDEAEAHPVAGVLIYVASSPSTKTSGAGEIPADRGSARDSGIDPGDG